MLKRQDYRGRDCSRSSLARKELRWHCVWEQVQRIESISSCSSSSSSSAPHCVRIYLQTNGNGSGGRAVSLACASREAVLRVHKAFRTNEHRIRSNGGGGGGGRGSGGSGRKEGEVEGEEEGGWIRLSVEGDYSGEGRKKE